MRYLTEEQRAKFDADGYLVLEDWLSADEVLQLRASIQNVLDSDENLLSSRSVFTTKEQTRESDEYFLGSGDKIRLFWEAGSFDAETGELKKGRNDAINKIGHNLHDLNPDFNRVSYDKRVGKVARDLGMEKPLACQSMYIFKKPVVGGEVSPHQDGTFLITEPQSVIGFWWALHDCTVANGCLWGIPGSHKEGVKRKFVRASSSGCKFDPEDAPPLAPDRSAFVPLEVKAGTLVLLHSAFVHASFDNTTDEARHAYSVHVVEGGEGFTYPDYNWLQRPKDKWFNVIPE